VPFAVGIGFGGEQASGGIVAPGGTGAGAWGGGPLWAGKIVTGTAPSGQSTEFPKGVVGIGLRVFGGAPVENR